MVIKWYFIKSIVMTKKINYKLEFIIKKSKSKKHHFDGYEAALQIPHVFPFINLINPVYPHEVPHEFLIFQF